MKLFAGRVWKFLLRLKKIKIVPLVAILGILASSASISAYYLVLLPRHDAQLLTLQEQQLELLRQTPTLAPTSTPTATPTAQLIPITPKPTARKWKFNNSQYEVSVFDVSYVMQDMVNRPFAKYKIRIKNISIDSLITGFQISKCEVVKNGAHTDYSTGTSNPSLSKAVVIGDTQEVSVNSMFNGNEYDSSGNKILPSTDLRIKSCTFQPSTRGESTSIQLHPVGQEPAVTDWVIEPTTIQFPN